MQRLIILFIILFLGSLLLLSNKEEKARKEVKSFEMKGLFFSYIEEEHYFKDKNTKEIKKGIEEIVKRAKENNFNTIILQVRSFSDALYNSKIFPKSINTKIDILDEFIKVASKYQIEIYAWINPYRISNEKNIPLEGPAKKWFNTDKVKVLENGIYYNPAKKEVRELIIKGVEEVIKYKVKGIIFDDYFYPSRDIDIDDYNIYSKNHHLSLQEYHLDNVNKLIKEVHDKIKSQKKNILFGISPDGNIDNNYNKIFADVRKWCSSNEYIDFIMPQIYYGFNNSNKPYINTINEWSNLIKNNRISLYFALAFYKTGNVDMYAKEGMYEWIENDDVIMRQVIIARNNDKYKGFALFRYDNIFDNSKKTLTSEKEFTNLQKVMK
ncbi:MAG: family 10 glycosylhydrolase [Bacilli bacterium]|nr:family 10 glycosylhydrolase [Bacilli bacterium]